MTDTLPSSEPMAITYLFSSSSRDHAAIAREGTSPHARVENGLLAKAWSLLLDASHDGGPELRDGGPEDGGESDLVSRAKSPLLAAPCDGGVEEIIPSDFFTGTRRTQRND